MHDPFDDSIYFATIPHTEAVEDERFLATCGADIAGLFGLWQRLRGTRRFPRRDELDILELKEWLGRLILYDVTHEPLDIRYRLVGSVIVQSYGEDLTGWSIKERCYSRNFDAGWRNLSRIAAQGCYRYRNDANAAASAGIDAGERLFLPFGEGDRVNIVLAYVQRPMVYRLEQRRRGTFAARSTED